MKAKKSKQVTHYREHERIGFYIKAGCGKKLNWSVCKTARNWRDVTCKNCLKVKRRTTA